MEQWMHTVLIIGFAWIIGILGVGLTSAKIDIENEKVVGHFGSMEITDVNLLELWLIICFLAGPILSVLIAW